MISICEYFTRYGNSGQPGACAKTATLRLIKQDIKPPAIRVCDEHAHKIVSRFPELGSIEERFEPIDQCEPPGACADHGRCWAHSYWADET